MWKRPHARFGFGLRDERGQVLILTTFSIILIFGMLGLAVDLGLYHYDKQNAQAAADAAATAAALHALAVSGTGSVSCGLVTACQAPTACANTHSTPPASTIETACLYAQQNGFRQGGNNGRQTVTVAANITAPPPTAPGVNRITYWATVRISENYPRLFSGILGSSLVSSGARATAAITEGSLGGNLYALNRQNDNVPFGRGANIKAGGNPVISAPGGIYMASTADGSTGVYAGDIQGSVQVQAPHTYIRGSGDYTVGGSAVWNQTPRNGMPDGMAFQDPMRGKGQPAAVPPGGLNNYVPVPGGNLASLSQPLQPGQYYAVDRRGNATGAALTASANISFADGGSGFGNYVFYGGLAFSNTNTTIRFSPGRYVVAGTLNGADAISIHTQVTLTDNSTAGQPNSDAGEIFIFTDANYPSLAGNIPPAVVPIKNSLGFGSIDLQAGNGDVAINLHGLNRTSAAVPADLKEFTPTVIWQDQRNSRVKYDSAGNIDTTSCGAGHSLDNPCLNANMQASNTPGMELQAHPGVSLYGLIYQPRGAWLTLQGNGGITSPLTLITGAVNLQGGATLQNLDPRDALQVKIVALIE